MRRRDFLRKMAVLPLVGATMNLQEFDKVLSSFPDIDDIMPVVFAGHGSPMNAIEDNSFTRSWANIGRSIPKPRAIVCISAHWETPGTYVTIAEKPKTIHDFYGFPDKLFKVDYPAPGEPKLAKEIITMITDPEVKEDTHWGLDHGTWSVLKHIYPAADVPVVQFSLDYRMNPNDHFLLAKQLKKLRRKGILVLGSGNMVHNLGQINWRSPEEGYDWADDANNLFKQIITSRDFIKLAEYNILGNSVRQSVPTPEHFLPLLYVLAQVEANDSITFFNDKCIYGSLSMTSVMIK